MNVLDPPSDPTFEAIVGETRAVTGEIDLDAAMRGPLEWYVSTFSVLNHRLTPWPAIASDRRVTAGVMKNLFGIWALVCDDALDKHDSYRDVIASALALVDRDDERPTPAGRLLRELLARAGALGDVTPLRVALAEYVTGQFYEHACRAHPWLVEAERFEHHRAVTMGYGPILAIDVLAAGDALTEIQRRALTPVYRELWTAWRYAYDLSSLERDRREGALNLVDVRGSESTAEELDRRVERAHRAARKVDVPGLADVLEFGTRLTAAWRASDLIGDQAHLRGR
jgi:Terpene synthase family 2, C-terminal metal binding